MPPRKPPKIISFYLYVTNHIISGKRIILYIPFIYRNSGWFRLCSTIRIYDGEIFRIRYRRLHRCQRRLHLLELGFDGINVRPVLLLIHDLKLCCSVTNHPPVWVSEKSGSVSPVVPAVMHSRYSYDFRFGLYAISPTA